MTTQELQKAEAVYEAASRQFEKAREERNAKIRQAVQEGWTHAQIAQATGLTRSRVGQIALT